MVASENDGLPRVGGKGGKVGGIGDVIRDTPPALADVGFRVTIATPSYGFFQRARSARKSATFSVAFRGRDETVTAYTLPGSRPDVTNSVLDFRAKLLGDPPGDIYHHDPSDRPFATDASKFALFCRAVAEGLEAGIFGSVDVLHLHDWHAGFLPILCSQVKRYATCRSIRKVFTIHNLSLQGIRPFRNDPSSLESWFPDVHFEETGIADPRWSDCVNPMAAGIRMSDAVHAVSPSYAVEITEPSDPEHGRWGGEGLEEDLLDAKAEHRLFGILNGCEYPDQTIRKADFRQLVKGLKETLSLWINDGKGDVNWHQFMSARLDSVSTSGKPEFVLTGVSRLVWQKVGLLQHEVSEGKSALDSALSAMNESNAAYFFLGSGDHDLSNFLKSRARKFENFVFLEGYHDEASQLLYRGGDAFLMPSLFEPCGISQMLALRAGQPCIVHNVGGLKDTIADGENGFAFDGNNLTEVSRAMLDAITRAISTKTGKGATWKKMRSKARESRFLWETTVRLYARDLYQIDLD